MRNAPLLMRLRPWAARVGWAATLLLVVVASLGPFLWILLTSFKSPAQIVAQPPAVWPDGSWHSYEVIFTRHDMLRFILNSALVAGATTLITVLLGALAAYPLARSRFRLRSTLLALILFASMFPQIAIVGSVVSVLREFGLVNTYPGLVTPYTALALPLCIWILVSFFREIPHELEEAARLDGASPWQALWRVFFPVAAPGVFTAAILVFIFAWNEFFFALLIMTDPAMKTLPVGIATFGGHYDIPWGEKSAAAVVATVPLVLVVLLLQKRIVRGLTAGAVKG